MIAINLGTHRRPTENIPKVVVVMVLVDRRRSVENVVQNRRIGALNFGEAVFLRHTGRRWHAAR